MYLLLSLIEGKKNPTHKTNALWCAHNTQDQTVPTSQPMPTQVRSSMLCIRNPPIRRIYTQGFLSLRVVHDANRRGDGECGQTPDRFVSRCLPRDKAKGVAPPPPPSRFPIIGLFSTKGNNHTIASSKQAVTQIKVTRRHRGSMRPMRRAAVVRQTMRSRFDAIKMNVVA